MAKSTCPTCGASTVEYRHSLSLPLIEGLTKLKDAGGGPINLKELGLTRNQWDNFQKLRYFGLVKRVHEDGRRRAGVWEITSKGLRFLAGVEAVEPCAWTYRGNVMRREGILITVSEVLDGYEQREEWANESVPVQLEEGVLAGAE